MAKTEPQKMLRVSAQLHQEITDIATREGRFITWCVERALTEWIARNSTVTDPVGVGPSTGASGTDPHDVNPTVTDIAVPTNPGSPLGPGPGSTLTPLHSHTIGPHDPKSGPQGVFSPPTKAQTPTPGQNAPQGPAAVTEVKAKAGTISPLGHRRPAFPVPYMQGFDRHKAGRFIGLKGVQPGPGEPVVFRLDHAASVLGIYPADLRAYAMLNDGVFSFNGQEHASRAGISAAFEASTLEPDVLAEIDDHLIEETQRVLDAAGTPT